MTAPAVAALRERLTATLRTRLAPPPKLTVSEWSNAYRMLSREASAEPGRYRSDRAPYQTGILDAFSDPRVSEVVVMSSAQIGKTEIVLNVVGFFVDQDAAPILAIYPTLSDAEQWSKTRLAPMIRDTPRLQKRILPPRSRESGNTLLVKEFPGGHITIVGANSASGLAAKPIRVVLGDEVDRWPLSAGTEGDPKALATKRTSTFWNRKLGWFSTPTLKGISKIEEAFTEGDQRRYEVPCPDCGERQTLKWRQLRWDDGHPETAEYCCEACGVLIPESQKHRMLRGGEWVAGAPFTGIASFHINALYSPWARWGELAREFIAAQGDMTKLQVFINTALGESWEDRSGGIAADTLEARKVGWTAEVPRWVGLLTSGVDVQHDRIEVVTRGWGLGEETATLDRTVLIGDPSAAEVWTDLDAHLLRLWTREDGAALRVHTTCIDSGDNTDSVYAFCAPRFARRIYATKGSSESGKPLVGRRPTANNKRRCRVFMVGTDTAKDLLYGRLKITTPGPYCHWFAMSCDADYFEQLTAERRTRIQSAGRWISRYEVLRGRRNEVADCEVLNIVALALSGARGAGLGVLAERLAPQVGPFPEAAPVPDLPADPPPARRSSPRGRRGAWVNRF